MSRVFAALWLPLLGIGVIAVVNIVGVRFLPEEPPPRSIAAACELVLGIVALAVAQLWMLVLAAPHDDRVSVIHFFLPAHVWMHSIKQLPETRMPVSLGLWGLALGAFRDLWVGGLSYWLEPKEPVKPQIRVAAVALY